MKIPFEDFDANNASQKLSFVEKTIITIGVLLGKAILWKVGKAKTYGDLLKLGAFVEDRLDGIGDSMPTTLDDNQPNFSNKVTDTLSEITKITKEVKKL